MGMLKCDGCRMFVWSSYCKVDADDSKDYPSCPSNGDETKCELYPERRKNAQERLEAEIARRIDVEWIDFDKQKPVHGDSVLGIDTEEKIEVYQYSDEWSSCLMKFEGNIKVFNITHWTFLPKPPKYDFCSYGERKDNDI